MALSPLSPEYKDGPIGPFMKAVEAASNSKKPRVYMTGAHDPYDGLDVDHSKGRETTAAIDEMLLRRLQAGGLSAAIIDTVRPLLAASRPNPDNFTPAEFAGTLQGGCHGHLENRRLIASAVKSGVTGDFFISLATKLAAEHDTGVGVPLPLSDLGSHDFNEALHGRVNEVRGEIGTRFLQQYQTEARTAYTDVSVKFSGTSLREVFALAVRAFMSKVSVAFSGDLKSPLAPYVNYIKTELALRLWRRMDGMATHMIADPSFVPNVKQALELLAANLQAVPQAGVGQFERCIRDFIYPPAN